MTVQELCDRLLQINQVRLAAVLGNNNTIPDTEFPEALTPAWLQPSVQAVFETTNRANANQDELIGNLEINAFMAAFQKSYENSSRNRISRWADVYSQQYRVVNVGGPLQAQLRHIGVKVEEEQQEKILPMRGV